jgi:TldD protein
LSEPLVDLGLAGRVIERALARGGDFAELFCEERRGFSLSIDESRIERPQAGRELGAGVRVVAGGVSHFAHVDGLAEDDLLEAAGAASAALAGGATKARPLAAAAGDAGVDRGAAGRGSSRRKAAAPHGPNEAGSLPLGEVEVDPAAVPAERKADLLRELDERARARGSEVAQVSASYAEGRRRVQVANSEGVHAVDDRTRVRLGAQVVARADDAVETGFETLGALRGFELLENDPARIAEQAADTAITLLGADPAPAGEMTVVVGGGFGGVLFHEMTGHGLEADAVQKGASVYAGRIGERVAEAHLNAYDDGVMAGAWGSGAIDDEGTPSQQTIVIEEGRLTSFLYDRLRAGKDGVASTGNGRRESFRHLPIPRMTNTYIAPGEADPEEVIGEVDRGFYAASFAGGQVDPATGDFVFGVSEGYLIEGGKVTGPCRGATLIGNCLQALARIDAVASDFEMKSGFCGKAGQRAPVGTGQGHVRIRGMTVGGTAT